MSACTWMRMSLVAMGEACAKTRHRMQLSAISRTPSHRGSPARARWFPLLQLNHQTLARQPGRTYLGPGDRVGDQRVPGGSAGQVHILRTGHLHLLRRGRQAAGCKRERELREQARKEGVAGRREGGAGRPQALPQLRSRSWSSRDIAEDCRSGALAPAFVPAEAAVRLPGPRGGHPESPGPAPELGPAPGPGPAPLGQALPRSPQPALLVLMLLWPLPYRGDRSPGGTRRSGGLAAARAHAGHPANRGGSQASRGC